MILQMNLFSFITEIAKRILQNFDIDLLKYEISDSISNLIDTLTSNFLLPHIFTYKDLLNT